MNRNIKNTGLFFGSFNPIHVGHIMIANYMNEFEGMDEVWFVVSPQNPFKERTELIPEEHRLNMVEIAVKDLENVKACDVEFTMPQPSYTIDTLNLLHQKYPQNDFHILMGSDNLIYLDRWKDADTIINKYPKLVYPRSNYAVNLSDLPAKTRITNAPVVDISSTMMREWISSGHNIKAFLPAGVFEYIKENALYV